MVVALAIAGLPAPAIAATKGERALLRRINAVRAAHNLRPVHMRRALNAIAVAHTVYIARIGQLNHDSADGTTATARIHRAIRVSDAGETLACGSNVGQLIRLWMNSPPHREILLDPQMRYIGLGVRGGRFDGYRMRFATADFAG
jgi:uncharacterized protein YkwD